MELVLIGVGLSMDAFAVALCKGLSMRRINYAHAAVIALFFGVFQAVMPLIGWVLGTQFQKKAEIAGGTVLVLIGLKILLEHIGLL